MNEPIKTTEELIVALEAEQSACMRGERVLPITLPPEADNVAEKLCGPMGMFLGAERMTHVAYYHEFRDKVWEYQREYNVSGLEIDSVELGGKTIKFPSPHDQLITTKDDLEVLAASRDRVVQAFLEYARSESVYLSHSHYDKWGGEHEIQVNPDYIEYLGQNVQWAVLGSGEEGIWIEMGWGDPNSARWTADKDGDSMQFEASDRCRYYGPPVEAEAVTLSAEEVGRRMKEKRRKERENSDNQD